MVKTSDSKITNREKKLYPGPKKRHLSHLLFWWELLFILKGGSKDFTENDLSAPLDSHESKKLADKLELAWFEEEKRKIPSLGRVLLTLFGLEFATYAIFCLPLRMGIIKNGCVTFRLMRPHFLKKLLHYYSPQEKDVTLQKAYMYAGLLVFATFADVIAYHWYTMRLSVLGMKIRVACCSLIYRKCLKQRVGAGLEVGKIINLLSNDANRFDLALPVIHFVWMTPIVILVAMLNLYFTVDSTATAGVLGLLLSLLFEIYLSKKISTNRMKVALKTDYRIQLMNDIVSGIKVIKMYTWEKPFSRLVKVARILEMQDMLTANLFRSVNYILPTFLNLFCIYLCVLAATLVGVPLSSSYVFVVELLYNNLNSVEIVYFPIGVTQLAELRVSIKRMEDFLVSPAEKSLIMTNRQVDKIVDSCTLISVQQKPFNVLQNRSTGVYLENIRARPTDILDGADFSAQMGELIGIVGAAGSGKSTLLQTILKEIDPMEGSVDVRGVVSYASQEPWFFSDSIRQNILFGKAMNRRKYHEVIKVCALEHDLSVLPFGDGTLIGEQGATLSGGQKSRISLARAIYRDADIYLLDDPLSTVDAHVAQHIFNECIVKYLEGKCVIMVTHQVQYLTELPRVYELNKGKLCRLSKSKELQPSMFRDVKNIEDVPDVQILPESLENDEEPLEVKEHRSTGSAFKKIYGVYLRAGGNWLVICVILFAFVLVQCCESCIEFFLSFWVNLVQEHEIETESERSFINYNCVYVYSGLLLCLVLVIITATLAFVHHCMMASKNVHNLMLAKTIHATMTFFNNHPSGRILNRFSKDIGNVDECVPLSLIAVIVTFLNLIAMFVTICVMNYWMILPTAFLLLICGVFVAVFLPSNRNMKRTEGVTRSPIYTHLASSLQGLTTIRAFNAQELLQNEFDNYQNVNSAAFYMYLAIYNAFAFWIDFICTIYVGIVIFSFFFIASDVRVGNIGLALIQLFQLELIQYAMKIWSDLETQMISVERVNDYTEITPEIQSGQATPPKSWPSNGNIDFNKISMRYTQDGPLVLYNVSFKIQAGEKIGIVGRTGAGKTSIVSALFRLYDFDGSITIDGINSKSISLEDLRSKIAIIPQEPVLFLGTLRRNLDLFNEFDDSQLWSALEDVELENMVSDLPSGLDTMIVDGGENFSPGQRQLLCLVRAMLRNVKIVVMDEATANVDLSTDAIIQATMRRKFRQCTVMTIAHRLDTVMDSDKILVLEAGRVVEFDTPDSLLQNVNGSFYNYVKNNEQFDE